MINILLACVMFMALVGLSFTTVTILTKFASNRSTVTVLSGVFGAIYGSVLVTLYLSLI